MRATKLQMAWAVMTVTVLGLAGCSTPPPEPTADSLVVAGPTDVTYDPLNGAGSDGSLAHQAVYDTLVVWDQAAGVFEPWLAESYELSDDKRVVEMTLRDDVDFIDGEHLDADGVVSLFSAFGESPSFIGFAGPGAEFTVTGEYSFELRMPQAIGQTVFQVFNALPVASPAALEDPESLSTTPVGTGPYLLDAANSTPGVQLTYTRNPDYWNPEAFPYDTLTIKTFTDNVAALNALKSGQVDATVIDVASAAEAENSGLSIAVGHGLQRMLFFGDRAGEIEPAIADLRVRQAINMAFDREAIAEALDVGYGVASSQVFVPGQPAFVEGRDDEYPYDLDRARELMAEAGYADGFDLQLISYPIFSIETDHPVVQQSLADLGIGVEFIEFTDIGEYLAAAQSGDYPVFMMNDFFTNMISNYLRPDALFSGWGYDDPHVTDLLAIMAEGGADESAAAAQDLGDYLLDEAWFAPFSQLPTVWASSAEVDVALEAITATPRLSSIRPAS